MAGVPARVAVPLPLSTNVTPEGRAPVSESEGFGNPAVVTVKDPADPSVKVVLAPEVMAGRLVDRQSEGLRGVRADPVGRRQGDGVAPPGPCGRRAGQGGGAVAVVGEASRPRAGPRSRRSRVQDSRSCVTVKLPALPAVKVVFALEVKDGATAAATILVEPSATGAV